MIAVLLLSNGSALTIPFTGSPSSQPVVCSAVQSRERMTKMRNHLLFFGCLILWFLLVHSVNSVQKCDRVPDGVSASKSPADGRFRIRIQGNPERYRPSEEYIST